MAAHWTPAAHPTPPYADIPAHLFHLPKILGTEGFCNPCVFYIPPGRPRRRWVDNIRMDLQEVGCGYMDWIGLAQDRDRWRMLVSAVMNLRVP